MVVKRLCVFTLCGESAEWRRACIFLAEARTRFREGGAKRHYCGCAVLIVIVADLIGVE